MARASVETIENKGGKKHLFPPDKFSGLRLTLASIVGLASVTGVFLSIKSIQERLNNPATVPSRNDSVLVPPSFSPTIDSNGIITRVASITETPTPVATPTPAETVEPIKTVLSEQERNSIRESIADLQKSLGIDKKLMFEDDTFIATDPSYSAFLAQRKEWGGTNDQFQNELPNSLKPFGDVVKFIADQALGDNSGRLVKGVRLENYGQIASTYLTDRYILFHRSIVDDRAEDTSSTLIHEVLGHGLDPDTVNASEIYSYDKFLQLQLSKWTILSRLASAPNAFINDKSDIIAGELAIRIGQAIGQPVLARQTISNSSDTQKIAQLLEASFKSVGHNQRVLNSKVTEEFGRQLIRKITTGEISLPKELQETYNQVWFDKNPGNSQDEMFAAMVSQVIMKPDLAPEIFQEIEQMLYLISGQKVDLQALAPKVTDMVKDAVVKAGSIPQSPAEMQKAKLAEENYQCFISSEACAKLGHGFLEIPIEKLPPDTLNNLAEFRQVLLKIYELFPKLKGSNSLHINPNFSPTNLTSQQADQLRYAADSGFIRNTLEKLNSGQKLTSNELVFLEAKTKVMKRFLPTTPKQ